MKFRVGCATVTIVPVGNQVYDTSKYVIFYTEYKRYIQSRLSSLPMKLMFFWLSVWQVLLKPQYILNAGIHNSPEVISSLSVEMVWFVMVQMCLKNGGLLILNHNWNWNILYSLFYFEKQS